MDLNNYCSFVKLFAVADPGFSRGRALTANVGRHPIIFATFPQKLHKIETKLDQEGGVPGPPPGSAIGSDRANHEAFACTRFYCVFS